MAGWTRRTQQPGGNSWANYFMVRLLHGGGKWLLTKKSFQVPLFLPESEEWRKSQNWQGPPERAGKEPCMENNTGGSPGATSGTGDGRRFQLHGWVSVGLCYKAGDKLGKGELYMGICTVYIHT